MTDIYDSFGKDLYRSDSSAPILDEQGLPTQELSISQVSGGTGVTQNVEINPDNINLGQQGQLNPDGSVSFTNIKIGNQTYVANNGVDTIQDIIDKVHNLGGGVVFLQNGTYTCTTDIVLYSNIYLQGESRDLTIIDFTNNTHSVLMKGSDAYTTGTIAVSHGGTTITGTGTTFTSAMVGRDILLQGVWYPIVAYSSATSLTIGIPYGGTVLSGASYTLATTISDCRINDVYIKNALYGTDVQYAKDCYFNNTLVSTSAIGLKVDTSANCSLTNPRSVACNVGFDFNAVSLFALEEMGIIDTLVGAGAVFTSCLNMSITDIYVLGGAANGLSLTSCEDVSIDGIIQSNGGKGIELISGNNDIVISNTAIESNTSDGIKFTATSDNCFISTCDISGNGGYGTNIAASTCDNNNITGNNFTNNTSGSVNDSGTGTVIRGNVGVSDNSTGAQTVTAITDTFTVGEAIAQNDALAIGNYHSDGGVKFDAKSSAGSSTLTTITVSFTVGNNSNRILVVRLHGNAVAPPSAVTYAGVSMTKVHSGGTLDTGDESLWILVAPATGANNVVITQPGGNTVTYMFHSYYNAAQTSQPHAQARADTPSGFPFGETATASITPTIDGCMIFGTSFATGATDPEPTGLPNNRTTSGKIRAGDNGQQIVGAAISVSITAPTDGNAAAGIMAIAPYTTPTNCVVKASAANSSSYSTPTTLKHRLFFLGFATEAQSSIGSSVIVVVSGAISSITGLTRFGEYYLSDTLGAISTTPGTNTRKVGLSLSTSKLLITQVW